jgi:putative flippase GtrA
MSDPALSGPASSDPAMSERTRFALFLVTGGVAAGVNIVTRMLLERFVSYEAAVGLAYVFGMVTAFILARVFVFKPVGGAAHGQFFRFALVNGVAFAQVWIVSVGLDRIVFPAIGFIWQAETVAHVIGVLSPVVTSYVLHKRFSFRTA